MGTLRILSVIFMAILPFCSGSFSDGALVDLSLLARIEQQTAATDVTLASLSEADARKYVFLTVDTHDGDFATGFAHGIAGADDFCATQKAAHFAGLPGVGGDYKALIVDATTPNRRACSTADCSGGVAEHIDWVLAPSTDYFADDGNALFTTNTDGIIDFTGGATLAQAFDANAGNSWWTGMLDSTWITAAPATFHCADWTNNAGGGGNKGDGAKTDGDAISFFSDGCGSLNHLLCVRQ